MRDTKRKNLSSSMDLLFSFLSSASVFGAKHAPASTMKTSQSISKKLTKTKTRSRSTSSAISCLSKCTNTQLEDEYHRRQLLHSGFSSAGQLDRLAMLRRIFCCYIVAGHNRYQRSTKTSRKGSPGNSQQWCDECSIRQY